MSVGRKYCSAHSPKWPDFYAKFNDEYYRNARIADKGGETLYIWVVYWILYRDESEIPDRALLQECHRANNEVFRTENMDDLNKLPDDSRHPWARAVGQPNIQFLPLDETKILVKYVQLNGSLSPSEPVMAAVDASGRFDGLLNVYTGSVSSGILGQAELGSNIAFVHYGTIGGPRLNGPLNPYHRGRTLTHEIGHSLSLVHTFNDEVCDHKTIYPDVPEQTTPNFNARFLATTTGYTIVGDNRDTERSSSGSRSCLSIYSQPDNEPNEMACNIMDYGDDNISVMFSESQALMMRTFLQSDENSNLRIIPADKINDFPDIGDENAKTTGSSSGPNTLTIVLIVLGCVLFIGLIAFAIYYNRKRSTLRHSSHTMQTAGR